MVITKLYFKLNFLRTISSNYMYNLQSEKKNRKCKQKRSEDGGGGLRKYFNSTMVSNSFVRSINDD